jgi:periplasmic protein TonB
MRERYYGFYYGLHLIPGQAPVFETILIHSKTNTMKPDHILQADMLDIIFEHRNRQYGAYSLRKYYNGRLIKAMAITFIIASALLLLSFSKEEALLTTYIYETPSSRNLPPEIPEKPVEPKKPQPKAKAASTPVNTKQLLTSIDIVKDNVQVEKIANLDSSLIGSKNIKGEPPTTFIAAPPAPVAVPGPAPEAVKVDKETPMLAAEVMPAYPGGMEALRKFLQKNLNTPQEVEEGSIISVKINFVVGYDGTLKRFEVVEDGGAAFNNEVMRVLKKMPAWIPGRSKGQNVSVYYTIPVKFTAAE